VPSDTGGAFLVVCVLTGYEDAALCVSHNCRGPSPNGGLCVFKVRVSLLLRKRGFAEARPWGIASARCAKTYKQRTNVKEVFGWAVVGRPSRAGPRGQHRRDGTRRLCLLSETEFSVPEAYIIHTNRLQTRSRDRCERIPRLPYTTTRLYPWRGNSLPEPQGGATAW
jgi:hypothetical protein